MTTRPDDPLLSPHSPGRVLALLLLLVFAAEGAIMLGLQWLPEDWRGRFLDSALDATTLVVVLAPVLWYVVVSPLRRLVAERGRLLRATFEAQEQERGRVARDLHDGIGQQLTAIMVGLRNLEEAGSPERSRERVHDLRELAAQAHVEVRRIARGLRPALLEELGLVPALERLCDDVRRSAGLSVIFRCDATSDVRFEPEIETALYRIAQEGLMNAVRHASATQIELELVHDERSVALSVRDDGRGFDASAAGARPSDEGGFGLGSVRERARMLGAEVDVTTQPDRGTRLGVRVPLGSRG